MIRHLVLVRFRDDVATAEISAIFDELRALRSVLPGMLAFTGGENVSPEGLARGFTHAFSCDFKDAGVRDAYLVHPAHKAAGERLVAATQGGVDGLAVVDFKIV